jgi:ABC-type sugar transport system permease subunit
MQSEKERAKTRQTLIKYGFLLSIIGIPLLQFIVFYVIQNGNSFLMAFKSQGTNGEQWDLYNFERFFSSFKNGDGSSQDMGLALTNTLKFYGLSVLLMPVALLTSYFMYKKVPGYRFMQIMFFIPSILSTIVWSTIYKQFLGAMNPAESFLPLLVQKLFKMEVPPEFLVFDQYALGSVMMYSVWLGVAGNFILYNGAMTRIPVEVIEAGKLDGITWYREFAQIVLPLVFPTICTQFLLGLTGLFTASGNILYLTAGQGKTTTISFLIFDNVYKRADGSGYYNYAACVGLCFTVVTLPLVAVSRYFMNKVEDVQY